MKILVVGGGGREHAIIRALKKSPRCSEIWCAPGNGGISYDAHCKAIPATDVDAMVKFAKEEVQRKWKIRYCLCRLLYAGTLLSFQCSR